MPRSRRRPHPLVAAAAIEAVVDHAALKHRPRATIVLHRFHGRAAGAAAAAAAAAAPRDEPMDRIKSRLTFDDGCCVVSYVQHQHILSPHEVTLRYSYGTKRSRTKILEKMMNDDDALAQQLSRSGKDTSSCAWVGLRCVEWMCLDMFRYRY